MRLACLVLLCLLPGSHLAAQTPSEPVAAGSSPEFRIETELYIGDAKKPQAEHLTLFSKGLVFDLLRPEESQITVFDLARDRIILLDRRRELRCVLAPQDLIDLMARIRAEAPEQMADLGVDAEVTWRDEPSSGWTAAAGQARYLIRPQSPPSPKYARAFAEFADWSARLNAYRKVGSAPFLRMALNARLASMGQLPDEVLLSISPLLGPTRIIRTKHLANYQLSNLDREKIAAASRQIATYQQVSWNEFVAGQSE